MAVCTVEDRGIQEVVTRSQCDPRASHSLFSPASPHLLLLAPSQLRLHSSRKDTHERSTLTVGKVADVTTLSSFYPLC